MTQLSSRASPGAVDQSTMKGSKGLNETRDAGDASLRVRILTLKSRAVWAELVIEMGMPRRKAKITIAYVVFTMCPTLS